ncbi:MAG: ABC transporter ATP-binding protein [Hyphomonadaceae bacterium]|jgi:ABC-2 type transport system ATP-binding protein|nr:ABC transporter ATP-binding protein [Hyphomonadaceae bacterium]
MLQCRSLTKRFGARLALDRLDLTLEAGAIVALLGPNGAGKTTCMRLLSGVLEPDAGDISLFGLSHDANSAVARALTGYLPEGAPLQADLTVREHLEFAAGIRGFGRRETGAIVASVAAEASVGPYLDTPVRHLSKGYRRRAALAATLVGGPELLLLDEPTDGLDPIQKQVTRSLLQRLKPGRIILMSTHALDDVEAIADRVVLLANGRLVADEPVAAFRARALRAGGAGGIGGLETVFAELAGEHGHTGRVGG